MACTGGGGGLVDHARQQRLSTTHGVNQARTRRRVTGQGTNAAGSSGGRGGCLPPRGRGRGRLVATYQVVSFGSVAGSVVATTSRTRRLGPQPAAGSRASAAHQVSVWPSRKRRTTGVQSPGCWGPPQASCRAASCGV